MRSFSNPTRRRWEPWLVWIFMAAIGWNYFSNARAHGPLSNERPAGYYGFLVDAFTSGQLHLKLIPDPKLLQLADPYAGPQGANRPHDMSFYRGKFYLYYGSTPALVLMIPWYLLTGAHLNEITVTAFFCYAGLVLSVTWLLGVRRRTFPNVSSFWIFLCVTLLGFGSPIYFLSENPTFYAVPISAAFFCVTAAGWLIDRTLKTKASPTFAVLLLGCASFWLALAVGARPNYVLTLPLLLLPGFWLWKTWRTSPASTPWKHPELTLAAAAILPAAIVGGGLALYNYLRFGNPLDFGIQYSMASASVREIKLTGFEYYPKNFRLYLLHSADFIRYYPFVFSGGSPFGILPHFSIVGVALFLPFLWFIRSFGLNRVWLVGALFWIGASLANLAVLSYFFGGENRYLIDFTPTALLAACAVLLALVQLSRRWFPLLRQTLRGLIVIAAGWSVANGLFLAFTLHPPSSFLTTLERAANRSVYAIEQLGHATHGPLELKLRFPTDRIGQREPLVTTGTLVGTGDILYVYYTDAQHVQFGFFHLGAGGPLSEPIAVDYAQEHLLTLSLGSLYPPREHPLFQSWSEAQVNQIRRRLEVNLDGKIALQASVNVYVSTPDGVHVGANDLARDVTSPRFTGTLLSTRRLGAQPPVLPAVWPSGPVRLTLKLPPARGGAPLPLISTGKNGLGDLLSLQILDDGRVRFIHDCWGSADYSSSPIKIAEQPEHVIDVEMGSLYGPEEKDVAPQHRRRLALWLDGQLVMDVERPFNPAAPDSVEFGFNAIEASSAVGMFTGNLVRTERIPSRAAAAKAEEWGPLALTLRLSTVANGLSEPLLCTGKFGAADLIFVQYVDANHVRFGVDHWGYGLVTGPLVEVDYAQIHTLSITLGSLFPSVDHEFWKARPTGEHARLSQKLEIRLNDRVVLTATSPAHPSSASEVIVGRNDVGASNCARIFSGEIVSQRRLPLTL